MAATNDAVPPMSAPTSADIALKRAGSMCISLPKRIAQERFSLNAPKSMGAQDRRLPRPKDLLNRVRPPPDSCALIDANEAIKRLPVRFAFLCFVLLRCPLLAVADVPSCAAHVLSVVKWT